MKRSVLRLDEALGSAQGPGGQADAGWALEGLRLAMEQELTGRQRQCVELYFFQQLTMEEIGQQLGIGKATVCRHLQKAQKRLRQTAAYMELGRRSAAGPKE